MTKKKLEKSDLEKMFLNKNIRISFMGRTESGICIAIHSTPKSTTPFDVELDNHSRYGIKPETVTKASCEGYGGGANQSKRKIEVIQ